MLILWALLLVLALLAGSGESQSCKPIPGGNNLAKYRPACQSSTFAYEIIGLANKAVDEICDGDFYHGSCTHTNGENNPWWYVDLGAEYAIAAMVVKNREDCCGERLKGAEVRVGNSISDHGKSNPLCGNITDGSNGSISTLYCKWMRGRYVSIHIPRQSVALTLCEVEVYGLTSENEC